ncbi:MAG: hypothetical protein WD708_11650 [Kiritimatiellia bacterium]
MKRYSLFFQLWILAALLSPRIQFRDYEEGRSRDLLTRVEVNQSALARIMGEFRTGASDMLFIKTERYLHSGVGYVPHLTEALLSVEGTDKGVEAHMAEMREGHEEEGHDPFHHEEEAETLVPTPGQDYRRWLGEMHRTVKPWRDPGLAHQHSDGKELIPWFRMMTLSDPHYIRGYIVGAHWIKRHDPEAAMKFVEEGLIHNPNDFQLHLSKAFLMLQEARRMGQGTLETDDIAVQGQIVRAKRYFQRAAEEMARVRPREVPGEDIADHPDWGTYHESDAMAAAHMAILLEERYGDPDTALELKTRYQKLMPGYERLQR